jgi:hypothetical protein
MIKKTFTVVCAHHFAQINPALNKFNESLRGMEIISKIYHFDNFPAAVDMVVIDKDSDLSVFSGLNMNPEVQAEGYEIQISDHNGEPTLFVLAHDKTGAMYGVLDAAEQIRTNQSLNRIQEKVANASFPFRALKFNLPWSSYRFNECFEIQKDTVKDLKFWERFLDMMVANRYNALTLWSQHPYPYMIKPIHFPLATPFSDAEIREWKLFWSQLFRMAKERGIDTYMVTWNIFVSEEFKKNYDPNALDDQVYHFGDAYSTNEIKQYTKECVTQMINEYPDLTGIGTAVGERMNDMTSQERQDWIADVYFTGMQEADRPVKFIHRAPFSVDPSITREAIESSKLTESIWLEFKFNWSHAYSSPKLLLTHGGTGELEKYWNPLPKNYKITWMIRNEDFFTLRWAQPDFVRAHIEENGGEYVGGYYIGSECFIPGIDYSHVQNSHKTWDYAFEKNWLYYMLWGRLLYDPSTPDSVFTSALDQLYGKAAGSHLLDAYSLVCQLPMALASFFKFTWDFTLYAEGFLSTNDSDYDDGESFISIEDLRQSSTTDPTYLSVKEYVERTVHQQSAEGYTTPLELANRVEGNANKALQLVQSIQGDSPTLHCEIADIQAWSYLSFYFANKLRAAVSFETYLRTGARKEQQNAVEYLQTGANQWEGLIAVTKSHYVEQPLMHLGKVPFSWELFRKQVQEDISIVDPSIT